MDWDGSAVRLLSKKMGTTQEDIPNLWYINYPSCGISYVAESS